MTISPSLEVLPAPPFASLNLLGKLWDLYLKSCHQISAIPIRSLVKQIEEGRIKISNYGLSRKGTRALSCILQVDTPANYMLNIDHHSEQHIEDQRT